MLRRVGRYDMLDAFANGGMATVHLGHLRADGGFTRVVAIKMLQASLASDAEFRSQFLDEARLVSRIRHANVVSTLDVLDSDGDLLLVMDYVHGPPLSGVLRQCVTMREPVPLPVVSAILIDTLEGLHAAHEARGEAGQPLRIVHRDVSPQNILVGSDGVARVLDFGIAHAADRLHRTMPGQIKGKAAYMAPEQATGEAVDRRVDVYAASVVLWETLTCKPLFQAENFSAVLLKQLYEEAPPPSSLRPDVPASLDHVVLRGLAKAADDRFSTAREVAQAIDACVKPANHAEVAIWLGRVSADFFRDRDVLLERMGQSSLGPSSRAAAPAPARGGAAGADETRRAPLLARSSRGSRDRRPRPSAVAPLAVGLVLAALAVLGLLRELLAAPSREAGVAEAGTTATALPAPPPSEQAVVTPVTPEPSASITSDVRAPRSVASAAHAAARRAEPPPAMTVAPKGPAAAPSSLPPCCVDHLQLRFHDCVDNCAK